MRQRAVSAVVLVPVLLIVLAIGGPVLAAGVALLTVLAGIEVFRLLKSAGYAPFAALGCVLALAIALEAAFPGAARGQWHPARRHRHRARSGSRDSPRSTRATACRPGWRRCSAPSTSALLAFIIRLGDAAPDVPANAPLSALGAERGWILLLVLAVWSFDTGAYLTGRSIGRTQFLTHISPSKTVEGVIGGVVASTVVVALMLWGSARPRPRAWCSVRWSRSPHRPATSPNR